MIKTSFQLRTIGTLLKERRKERKLTLSQISEITKIRVEYLKALEEGHYDVFPSEVYLKGFLKNYAKFLEINTERALAMYRREREFRDNEPTIAAASKISDKGVDITITPGKILAAVAIAAVLLILIYIGSYVGRILKVPELSVTAPVSVDASGEGSYRTSLDTVEIDGTIEIGATLTINGQELKTNNFTQFTKQFKLQPGLNSFVLAAESQFGRKAQLTLNVVRDQEDQGSVSPSGSPIPSPTPTPATTMAAAITIIGRDAYIEVGVDGKTVTARTYTVGSSVNFTANSTFSISSPRPDAVKLLLNGIDERVTTSKTTWKIVNGQVVKQ